MSSSALAISTAQKETLWRERIARQRTSGKTIAVFCQEEDLGKSTFSNWRRRLLAIEAGQKSGAAGAPFLDLGALKTMRPGGGVPHEPAGRVEVHLELGGGVVLHIARH